MSKKNRRARGVITWSHVRRVGEFHDGEHRTATGD